MSSNQTPDTPIARGEARGWSHNPSLPIGVNPTFAWPPRPAAALGWIGGTWLRFTPMVIIFLCAVVGNLLLPDAERMKTLAYSQTERETDNHIGCQIHRQAVRLSS